MSARPTRVIKLGGRAQAAPDLAARLAAAAPSAQLIVVHGGGDEVTALQRQMGVEPVFVHGRRVTRAEDLDAVRMILSGTVNKRLVAQTRAAGLRAVGVSGEDGGLLTARVTDPTYGRVGREVRADVTILRDLLAARWTPIVSPLATDRDSAAHDGLNVNGDDAAAAIAESLGADELLFISDVPGVLDAGVPVPALDAAGVADLVARGVVQGGMRAKLEAALLTLAAGVGRVRIAPLDGLDDPAVGTSLLSALSTRTSV
ncbi:MAG: acetylglutamate kinase [Gemmatimonadetes bacterium]|nr:acetylglutamate kinase [Gemmatimonadota bacterium]